MREKDFEYVFAEWLDFKFPEIVKREVDVPLEHDLIISVVGPRQAGKTFLMYQIIQELWRKIPKDNVVYINFEHERLRGLDALHLEDMMKTYYKFFSPLNDKPIYLFLDEIQNVRDWDKWVRNIYEKRKYRLVISGSSSKLLSREISTSLRGRSIDITVLPFSFREFLNAKGINIDNLKLVGYSERRGRLLGLLEEYLRLGGYPKVVLTKDYMVKRDILRSYYEAIFYRDLIERYKIRDATLLDIFLRYLMSSFSKYVSISRAYNYLKGLGFRTSKSSLIKFMSYAEEVFLVYMVEILSPSIKARKQYPRKVYCVDNGIVVAKHPEALESMGRLMENVVFIELMRRSRLGELFQVYYWREYGNRTGREVDFVIVEGFKAKQLIQVTYVSNGDEVGKREIEALLKASKELNCKNLLIITWDYDDEMKLKERKIKFIPLWRWLLSDFKTERH